MLEQKKILESTMKVRFHDCDPFNHLNNSRYIDYLVTARGDQLIDNYGFDIYKLASESGIGWVTGQTQISYMMPAFLMEEVKIQTQLIRFSKRTLLLEAFMWDLDKKCLKAAMWTSFVHYNLKTQRSYQHSEDLMDFFGQIVNPLAEEVNFDERVKTLKRGIKN
ncbi:acyl-CoA thioesterase [Daejeonella sp.]|uniref:acyl-CoA thioesterase n=1 Tax=Daejeonella sp. TaxID=2805397 RepID=UPI0030BE0728